jgi:hypothetical protein
MEFTDIAAENAEADTTVQGFIFVTENPGKDDFVEIERMAHEPQSPGEVTLVLAQQSHARVPESR